MRLSIPTGWSSKLGTRFRRNHSKSNNSFASLGNNATKGRRLSLLHTLAMEAPAPKDTNIRRFTLTLASGQTHLFEIQASGGLFKSKKVEDADAEVSAWVQACNYHAALYSRAPLPGALTNVEYGWNGVTSTAGNPSGTNDRPSVLIDDWVAPDLPSIEAQADNRTQLDAWEGLIRICNAEFAKHGELRGKMMRLYRPGSPQARKALSNWEKKSQYLLAEIVKYETYAEILRNSGLTPQASTLGLPSVRYEPVPSGSGARELPMGREHKILAASQPLEEIINKEKTLDELIHGVRSPLILTESPIHKELSSSASIDSTGYVSDARTTRPSDATDAVQPYSPRCVAFAMYECLVRHGCLDLMSSIDPLGFSSSAVAEGGFGDVWTGRLHNNGTKVAIKVLRFASLTSDTTRKELKRITREIYHWSKLDHENVNKLMGVMMFRERLGMISEWTEHGNLRQYLSRNGGVDLHELCVQIAKGVTYLHGVNMVHGDLKAHNILVSSNGVVKITDFDYSIFPECSLVFSATTRMGGGTLRWMAPELLLDDKPPQRNTKTDIYALGMTFLETTTNAQPYSECERDAQIYRKLARKEHPERSEQRFPGTEWGNRMWSLLLQCWDFNPASRPISDDILESLLALKETRDAP